MIVKLKGFIEFCSEEYIDLDVNGIDLDQVKNKIGIEVAWNDLIVNQFADSIKVNEKMIKEKINVQKKNTNIENLLFSEIIFTINDNNEFQEKYSKIKIISQSLKLKKEPYHTLQLTDIFLDL